VSLIELPVAGAGPQAVPGPHTPVRAERRRLDRVTAEHIQTTWVGQCVPC
jgi:hypothetical protein